jgi:PhzF family phenazine biosynthesis protein
MRRFAQVDVFTTVAGFGNPVAVVLDADGLDDATMARVARWTNLSETTFVLPPTVPGAHYRARIFTPAKELPMAGHPTLGTCRALVDAGVIAQQPEGRPWIQECAAGLIPVHELADGAFSFAAPPAVVTDSPFSHDVLSGFLTGVRPADPVLIDVGPKWLTGRVGVDELEHLQVDGTSFLRDPDSKLTIGVTLYAIDDEKTVHVRSFFDGGGVLTEDPVCGTGNAAVGVHLKHTGGSVDVPASYQARQGRHRGRDGRITVTLQETEDGSTQVWVGGHTMTVVSGTIAL